MLQTAILVFNVYKRYWLNFILLVELGHSFCFFRSFVLWICQKEKLEKRQWKSVVIILDIEQKKRREREKEIRASFFFCSGLNFASFLLMMYMYVCLYVMLYPFIDRAQAYIYEWTVTRKKRMEKKEKTACTLFSLFAYVYIWAAPRPFWREQRTTSKNERAEKDREKKRRKRKGNTNEQRTLAHTYRSGTLFWLLLIIGHHHKNRTHVHIHRDNHTTTAVIFRKW
jgi:hypothetical protein